MSNSPFFSTANFDDLNPDILNLLLAGRPSSSNPSPPAIPQAQGVWTTSGQNWMAQSFSNNNSNVNANNMYIPQLPSQQQQLPVVPKTAAPRASMRGSKKNLRFLILIRILMKDLEATQDFQLKQRVKFIIRECNRIRREDTTNTNSLTLQEQVETLLKLTVGNQRWENVTRRLNVMMMQRRQRHSLPFVSQTV